MVTINEKTALLSSSKATVFSEPDVDLKTEFWALSSMALQVSMATFARIGLYSIDYAFLGHLGTSELAAASLSNAWTGLPLFTVWSGASAITTLSGQAWGAKNGVLSGIWLQMGLTYTSICMIFVFIWYWCIEYTLELSTSDPDVIRLGAKFARILSFSIWPTLSYVCVRVYFQSMGILMPTTIVGMLSIIVAICANYVLIYGCFGWQGFGFEGSALATVTAAWFQPIALVSYCIGYKKLHLQAWGGWNFKEFTRDRIRTYVAQAGPISLNSLVTNLASSSLALVAAKLGPDVIAANAIIAGFWRLLWALFWGFGSATQIRVANYLGAGRPQAAVQLGKLGFLCTIVCVAMLASMTIVLREDIFRLYTSDDNLLKLCLLVQPIFITGFMLESMEMLMAAILTAMGQVKVTAMTSIITIWLVEVPIAYVGGIVLGYGFSALWYSICVLEIIKFCVYAYTLLKTDWAYMAKRAQARMEVMNEEESKLEDEALNVAAAEGGDLTYGVNAGLPSPVTPLRISASQWEMQEEGELWQRVNPRRQDKKNTPSALHA